MTPSFWSGFRRGTVWAHAIVSLPAAGVAAWLGAWAGALLLTVGWLLSLECIRKGYDR